jgi:hypothetical protein
VSGSGSRNCSWGHRSEYTSSWSVLRSGIAGLYAIRTSAAHGAVGINTGSIANADACGRSIDHGCVLPASDHLRTGLELALAARAALEAAILVRGHPEAAVHPALAEVEDEAPAQ